MFAHVTTVYLPEASTAAEILQVHERLYTSLKKLTGSRDYMALVNRNTGEAKAIILWESKEDLAAHRTATRELLSRIGVDLETTPPQEEEYDVAYHT